MITDPRKFVASYLKHKKITVDERGSLASPDKKDYFHIFDTLWLDYMSQLRAHSAELGRNVKGESEKDLKKALDELINDEMLKRRETIYQNLRCTGESLDLITTFVKALTGTTTPHIVGVMAHWLWQIKRRLCDQPVVYQIMPIIFGAQGAGKSVAVQKLLYPLTNLTLELSLTEVTDARFYFSLNTNFAVVLDEMAGARRADVEALKKQITANYNDARQLGTNKVIKIKQNASLIGTSNRPVSEIVFDPTGARRFFQIDALNRVDWDVINSLDYTLLFRGINEERERGYVEEHLLEIVREQENLVGQDELGAFMEHFTVKVVDMSETKEIAAQDLYDKYSAWCKASGVNKPDTAIWFGRRIKNRGIQTSKKRVGGKLVTLYHINKDSAVHGKVFDSLDVVVTPIRRDV